MHPVAYIEFVSVLACLAAIAFVIRGWKRTGFLRAVPILLLTLLLLMMFYGLALFLEWSGLGERLRWHFIEDFASVFIPFIWAFVLYAIIKNAVEENLSASREHFRDLVESSSDWIWEIDAAGRYIYTSPRVADILGYTPDELIGKTPFDLMPTAEAERISAEFDEIVKRRASFQDLVNVNLHKDGHEVVLETNGMPVFDNKRNLIGYRGVDRDITRRLEGERLQKQQQAEMDSLFRASPAGVGLVRKRCLVRGNERFFEITGYPEDELTGMDPHQLYLSEQEYFAVGEKYTEALAGGVAWIETRFVRKDQVVIDVVIYIAPLDRDNADAGFVVALQDITEFKAARQEAVAEKTRAQTYLDVAAVMILVLDTTGCVKLINRKGCEILERSVEQLEGADWFKTCLPPSYQQISRNAFQRIIDGNEKSVAYFESPIYTASGAEKLIAWHNTSLRDDSGRIIAVISSGEDITEARTAEKAQRESEECLRVALSAAQMGTWRWEAATNRVTRDANLNALLGQPSVETPQDSDIFYSYVHPDDRGAVKQEFERAIRQRDTYLARFRIQRADGSLRWALDQGKPFYDFNGQLEYVTGVMVDITEQVEAQQRYQNIIDSAPMGIITYELEADDRLVLTGANQAANAILGVNFSVSAGKTIEEVFPALEDTALPDEYRRICKNGGIYHGDNFEYHDEHVSGLYEFDAFQTSPGNVAVAFTDVTERKRSEERLKKSEQRNRAWLENSPVCTKIVDLDFNLQYMSYAGIAGLKIDDITEFYGKPYPFDFYPESFKNTMTQNLEKARETGEIIEQEAPVVDIEGNELWYHSTIVPVKDDKGRIDYIIIVSADTTERKVAEQQLQFTQFAIDHSGDAAYWMGPDAKFIYVNELACQSLGYTRDELMQMAVYDIDPDFPVEAWPEHWDQLRKHHTMRLESHHKTKDGRIFPVEITANFVEYDGHEYNCAFARDITGVN